MLAQKLDVRHVLRGFFALPSVFTTSPDAQMLARSFAAWRELNRFMVINPDFPMPTIQYVEQNPVFRIYPTQRLFDACYLVDGKRGGAPIAEEAKYGVFPMLAESISTLLDKKAGTLYTQWITQNLAEEYARHPETPMYKHPRRVHRTGASALRGRSFPVILLPSRYLLKLLSPMHDPDKKDGKLITMGAERHLALAAPDRKSGRPRLPRPSEISLACFIPRRELCE